MNCRYFLSLAFVLAGVVPIAARGQTSSHSETLFAHELLRLNQPNLVGAELKAAANTPAENLWKAEWWLVSWDGVSKSKADRAIAEREYLSALPAYLDLEGAGVDGVWALDHAKFIFARLSEPILNRMEYWGATAKDRATLAPMAGLADRLLKQSALSLTAGMREAESKTPFDEATYTRNVNALAEVDYYATWSEYFQAMALEPSDPARKELLGAAATALGKWADDKQDNGVNNQSLLLRGKIRSEAGDLDQAAADLTRAAQIPMRRRGFNIRRGISWSLRACGRGRSRRRTRNWAISKNRCRRIISTRR